MSPLKATCNECYTEMNADWFEDLCDMMIAHHNKEKQPGSWTSGGHGLFDVVEIDEHGKVVEGGARSTLEATMNTVVKPYTKTVLYRPGKER